MIDIILRLVLLTTDLRCIFEIIILSLNILGFTLSFFFRLSLLDYWVWIGIGYLEGVIGVITDYILDYDGLKLILPCTFLFVECRAYSTNFDETSINKIVWHMIQVWEFIFLIAMNFSYLYIVLISSKKDCFCFIVEVFWVVPIDIFYLEF